MCLKEIAIEDKIGTAAQYNAISPIWRQVNGEFAEYIRDETALDMVGAVRRGLVGGEKVRLAAVLVFVVQVQRQSVSFSFEQLYCYPAVEYFQQPDFEGFYISSHPVDFH